MIAILTKTQKRTFCEDGDHHEDYDHGRCPHKDSNRAQFCEYFDHGCSLNKEDYDHESQSYKD